MRASINRQFSFKERLWYVLYRLSVRIQQHIPKNLAADYSFFFTLDRMGGRAERKGNLNQISYKVNGRESMFLLRRDSSDFAVFVQIIFEEEYERVISLLKEIELQPKTIIDAGCNIGLTSIYLKAFFPDARVICIEPAQGTAEVLNRNIQLNKLSDVHIENKGLWSKTCFLRERSFRDNKEWSFSLEESDKNDGNGIEAISITTLMKNYDLATIDFLKIDVEGAEKNIFLEDPMVANWLTKVKLIAIEIHDEFNCRTEIEDLLRSLNFEIHYSGELTIGVNQQF